MDNYWIDISFGNEETAEKYEEALDAAYTVYCWSREAIADYWRKHLTKPTWHQINMDLTKFIHKKKLSRKAQRYTLNTVLKNVMISFPDQISIDQNMTVQMADPIAREDYRELDIETRKIWRKYMAETDRLTTAYGVIFLEGEWRETLRQQAKDNKTAIDLFPYLWHSVTLRKQNGTWQLRFNAHTSDSNHGKKAAAALKAERTKG